MAQLAVISQLAYHEPKKLPAALEDMFRAPDETVDDDGWGIAGRPADPEADPGFEQAWWKTRSDYGHNDE